MEVMRRREVRLRGSAGGDAVGSGLLYDEVPRSFSYWVGRVGPGSPRSAPEARRRTVSIPDEPCRVFPRSISAMSSSTPNESAASRLGGGPAAPAEADGRVGGGELDAGVIEDVRLAVYSSLARTGRLPSADALTEGAGSLVGLAHIIQRLAGERAWALGPDGSIELAHPFATRSFGYSVMSSTTLWWGGCCWDSFAIPHLVPECGPVVVAGACPACRRALAWRVETTAPPVGAERAHFLVPTSRMWDDVLRTCSNQLLFCNDGCIDAWLVRHGHEEGYRMDLETLWHLAARWYEGRLERGYRRREPAQATAYLRSVGLSGPFWGMPDH